MHQRTQDSIMLSTMALAVIAGKIISSALAQPNANNDIGTAGAGSPDEDAADMAVVAPDKPRDEPAADAATGTAAPVREREADTDANADADTASAIQSAPASCDAATAQHARFRSVPPLSAR